MNSFFIEYPLKMELVVMKFKHDERKCYLPIIINFTNLPKRKIENELLTELMNNLKRTDGISEVNVVGGGIDTFDELTKIFDTIIDSKNYKIKFLDFYKRETFDTSDTNYLDYNYIQIKYNHEISFPVKVLDSNKKIEEFGDYPLPIVLME